MRPRHRRADLARLSTRNLALTLALTVSRTENNHNTMGGTHGEIRGKSKADVCAKYSALVKQASNVFGDHYPDAKHKKVCHKLMEQDPNTEDWVLRYHLHT